MNGPLHALDRHFRLPAIRYVEPARVQVWLRQGWKDLRANPAPSLTWGLFYAILGYLVLVWATDLPHLLTAAVSGFMLIGPIAAAGLFELSRQHEEGAKIGFIRSIRNLRRNREQLLCVGTFLVLTLISWIWFTAMLFALFALNTDGIGIGITHVAQQVFLNPAHIKFTLTYILIGGSLAALVFALSFIAVPMLVDRNADFVTAMMTSLRAVTANLLTMLLWASILLVLMVIGFVTWIGLIVLFPLLGHASWHAYRDLVEL